MGLMGSVENLNWMQVIFFLYSAASTF